MKRGKMNIVIGGQAGSEAKGKLSGFLVDSYHPDLIVMTASPNAGHTVVLPDGTKKVSYHLPIGSVMSEDCLVVLTAASLINPVTFAEELVDLGIDPARVVVDRRAGIISYWDCEDEAKGKLSDIGSTLQGVGTARTKVMSRIEQQYARDTNMHHTLGVDIGDTATIINDHLAAGKMVLCEMTQGFDLDLTHGIHPRYCTSKMINPAMGMAEAGVPPQLVGDVYGVIRPFPIRVNNRTGTSGPYHGSQEISWQIVAEGCGHPDADWGGEITTTTKLPRRVFTFSWLRFGKFIRTCRPTSICLQFANYLSWDDFGVRDFDFLSAKTQEFVALLEKFSGVPVEFIGTGPGHEDMIRRRVEDER